MIHWFAQHALPAALSGLVLLWLCSTTFAACLRLTQKRPTLWAALPVAFLYVLQWAASVHLFLPAAIVLLLIATAFGIDCLLILSGQLISDGAGGLCFQPESIATYFLKGFAQKGLNHCFVSWILMLEAVLQLVSFIFACVALPFMLLARGVEYMLKHYPSFEPLLIFWVIAFLVVRFVKIVVTVFQSGDPGMWVILAFFTLGLGAIWAFLILPLVGPRAYQEAYSRFAYRLAKARYRFASSIAVGFRACKRFACPPVHL